MGRQARINAAKKAAAQANGHDQAHHDHGHTCSHRQVYRPLTDEELDHAFSGDYVSLETTFLCTCGRHICLSYDEPYDVCEPREWESYDPSNPPGCGRRWTIVIAVHEPTSSGKS